MSIAGKKPLALRVLKFMLGNDEPAFAAAAAAACLLIGMAIVFTVVWISDRPAPPIWQILGSGLALSLFLMPFLFMALERLLVFMAPAVGLATLTAAALLPVAMMVLRAFGIAEDHPVLFATSSLAVIPATFLITRWIVKRG